VRFLIDKTRTGIAGSVHAEELETLLKLIHLRWTKPKLDTAVFHQIKRKAMEEYRLQVPSSATRFARELDSMVNGVDYVTRVISDSIIEKELQVDRIIPAFQHAFGGATGYTFLVTGKLDDADKDLILDYLGALPAGEPQVNYVYQRPLHRTGVRLERWEGDKPSATVILTYQTIHFPKSYFENQLYNDMTVAVLRSAF